MPTFDTSFSINKEHSYVYFRNLVQNLGKFSNNVKYYIVRCTSKMTSSFLIYIKTVLLYRTWMCLYMGPKMRPYDFFIKGQNRPCIVVYCINEVKNKDKNVHRFALSVIRGELFEWEREKERESKNNMKCDKKGERKSAT